MRGVLIFVMATFVAIGCLGCGGQSVTVPQRVVVIPLSEQDLLDGKALLLLNANAGIIDGDEDKKPAPAKCLCGGTGRSGDGLGPCACPDGCTCKKTRAETPETPEAPTEPVSDEQQLEQDAPAPAEPDALQSFGDQFTKQLTAIEERVRVIETTLLEKAKASAEAEKEKTTEATTGFTKEQAEAQPVGRRVVAVLVSADFYCPPCERMEKITIPNLVSAGWTVSQDPQAELRAVKRNQLVSDARELAAIEKSKETGVPLLAYFVGDTMVKWQSGFVSSTAFADSFNQLVEQHNAASKEQAATTTVIRQRLPVVQTQWGTIDLETYQRNCNCPMCQGIRSLQQSYRQQGPAKEQRPEQAPTPPKVIEQVLGQLKLTSGDTLADLGCGDGRILIEACKRFGCRGVGVEIDPAKADEARARVKAAGLEGQITIVTGDALKFDCEQHAVTAVVAYLYPELLGKLRPVMEQVPVLVTPFHAVPGLQMQQVGDVFVRDTRAV